MFNVNYHTFILKYILNHLHVEFFKALKDLRSFQSAGLHPPPAAARWAGGGVNNHLDMVICVLHSRMIHSGRVKVLSVSHTPTSQNQRLVSKWSQKENIKNANVAPSPRRLHQTPANKLVPGLAGVLAARRRSSGLFIEL